MKNTYIFNTILYVLGIGLICVFFLIIFGDILSDDVYWLDMILSCGVYSLFMFSMGRLFISSEDMDDRWGGVGIRWVFIWIYSILAVVAMVVMHLMIVPFAIQIIIQLVFLLGLLFGFFFSMMANKQVTSVARQHQAESSGLVNMQELVSRFEIQISSKNPDKEIMKLLNDIKENVRYMSPSLDTLALDLENQFILELSQALTATRNNTSLDAQDVVQRLESCNTILKQRKNFRYK